MHEISGRVWLDRAFILIRTDQKGNLAWVRSDKLSDESEYPSVPGVLFLRKTKQTDLLGAWNWKDNLERYWEDSDWAWHDAFDWDVGDTSRE